MADKRMFCKAIIDSDAFLDMPATARLLYYDLAMRADDDGFVNSPKKIMRTVGASQDDMSILIVRKFLIPFDNGVVVIKHWRIHNYIRQDRYHETTYTDQKRLLVLDENKAYKLAEQEPQALEQLPEIAPSTICQPTVNHLSTNGRPAVDPEKSRVEKSRVEKSSLTFSDEKVCRGDPRPGIIQAWNSLGLSQITRLVPDTQRSKCLDARIREYGADKVLAAIENVRNSPFLRGKNPRGFVITFDWFVKPNNFCKVLDGNYAEHQTSAVPGGKGQTGGASTVDRLLRMAQEGAFDDEPK